ncbi:MAG: RNA polymerase sigma factor [Phycisphaeraceae bacterium]
MNTTAPPSDRELDRLVGRVRADRDAFAALYDRYYPRILNYCARRLYSRSVGEDLTSDVFLTAAHKIDTFRGKSDGEFSQWLYTIATNKINEHLRNFSRRRELLKAAAHSRRVGQTETRDNTDHLDWPAVYDAILQLKPRDQTLISLRYMQDLPHDQIAQITGLKPGNVRVALGRALDKLRERFNTEPISITKGASQ